MGSEVWGRIKKNYPSFLQTPFHTIHVYQRKAGSFILALFIDRT